MGNKKKACVFYSDWFSVAQSIDDSVARCKFYDYIMTYSLTGTEIDMPVELKMVCMMLRGQIDRDNERYRDISARRSDAARTRWGSAGSAPEQMQVDANDANAENRCKCTEKDPQNECNCIQTMQMDAKDANAHNKNKNLNLKNNPPQPPKRGECEGGGEKGFGIFLRNVATASKNLPEVVERTGMENQYIWRIAEGNPGYAHAIADIAAKAKNEKWSNDTLREYIQGINKRYMPNTDWQAYCFCQELLKSTITQEQATCFAEAIDVAIARGEADVWINMMEKLKYINSGHEITSLPAFLRAKKKNS